MRITKESLVGKGKVEKTTVLEKNKQWTRSFGKSEWSV